MQTFRMGQLNILNKHQEERLRSIAEAFKQTGLDFVAVQEVTNPARFAEVLEDYGYNYSSFSEFTNSKGKSEYVGVVSKHKISPFTPVTRTTKARRISAVTAEVQSQKLNIITAHFNWGGAAEYERLLQAGIVDEYARELELKYPGSLSVLGGDLNAEPDSRSVRYLTGKDLNSTNTESTYWTDAWATAGDKTNEVTTSHGTNSLGRVTAFGTGIAYPGYIPDRRIDYILTRGWNYGKVGSPLNFGYIRHDKIAELSDHNGIYCDLMLAV